MGYENDEAPLPEEQRKIELDELRFERDLARKEAVAYAEAIDNVRGALGLKATHYQVIADDVEIVVKERDGLRKQCQDLGKVLREVGCCPRCRGDGQEPIEDDPSEIEQDIPCWQCKGTGLIPAVQVALGLVDP